MRSLSSHPPCEPCVSHLAFVLCDPCRSHSHTGLATSSGLVPRMPLAPRSMWILAHVLTWGHVLSKFTPLPPFYPSTWWFHTNHGTFQRRLPITKSCMPGPFARYGMDPGCSVPRSRRGLQNNPVHYMTESPVWVGPCPVFPRALTHSMTLAFCTRFETHSGTFTSGLVFAQNILT